MPWWGWLIVAAASFIAFIWLLQIVFFGVIGRKIWKAFK